MNYLKTLLCTSIYFLTTFCFGQVSISLTEVETKSKQQDCFEIQLVNEQDEALSLLGQNYRLYYNSNEAQFIETSLTSYLSSSYQDLKIVEHHHDIDAEGFGTLSFDDHLGFINISTDFDETSKNAIVLDQNKAITIATMCFENFSDDPIEISWAQKDRTHTYATAFVELALLEADGSRIAADITDFQVRNNDATKDLNSILDVSFYPNPFSDKLTIDFKSTLNADMQLKVYDLFGKLEMEHAAYEGQNKTIIDAAHLLSGAYVIELISNDSSIAKQVVKALKVN